VSSGKKYVYYWYDHLLLRPGVAHDIEECIKNHNYDKFMEYYKFFQLNELINPEGLTYFPDHIAVFDQDSNLLEDISVFNRENFNKITYNEYECG